MYLGGRYKFSKTHYCLKAYIFFGNKYRLALFIFKKISTRYPSLNNHSFYLLDLLKGPQGPWHCVDHTRRTAALRSCLPLPFLPVHSHLMSFSTVALSVLSVVAPPQPKHKTKQKTSNPPFPYPHIQPVSKFYQFSPQEYLPNPLHLQLYSYFKNHQPSSLSWATVIALKLASGFYLCPLPTSHSLLILFLLFAMFQTC